jgi:hypothetical protein
VPLKNREIIRKMRVLEKERTILRSKQEREILEKKSRAEGLEKKVVPIFHEGGCILRTERHTIITDEYLTPDRFHKEFIENATPAQRRLHAQGKLAELYESIFGPVLFVPMTYKKEGSGKPRIAFTGHIDTFMAPADDQTILVGDLNLGLKLVAELSEKEKTEWEEKVKAAHPRLRDDISPKLIRRRNVPGYIKYNHAVLERAAQKLSEDYTVKRIPMPLVGLFQGMDCVISYPLIYSNGLLERQTGKAAVPIYGLKSTDQATEAVYRDCGYSKFKGINSLMDIFTFSGLRCNYMEKRV